MKQITFADGEVRLGGEALPGILVSLSIDGKVRYDQQKVDGHSGKSKTPQGWEDQTVKIVLDLLTDDSGDCYDKLSGISPFFKGPDDHANPQIYALINRHAGIRGIRKVIFDKLESTETSSEDTIRATLSFTEHRPPIVRTEQAEAKTPTAKELEENAKKNPSGATVGPQPEITTDVG
jgi:hypothetical protein